MELKEYLKIIKDNAKIFWGVVILVMAVTFAYFIFRPLAYNVSLTLNITRSGTQITDQYKFDDFYRLQADEKFADTVVAWLQSPRTVAEIYQNSGTSSTANIKKLSKALKAERLSSQVVAVGFSTPSTNLAKKISGEIEKSVLQNTLELNKNQKEDSWFEIIAHEPVISERKGELATLFIASLAAGIFLAFWVALIFHYVK